MTDESGPVLLFDQLTVQTDGSYTTSIWNANLSLGRGELALIQLEPQQYNTPLMDAALGLVQPQHGRVMFDGENWQQMSPDRACAMRNRTGRVFEGNAWLHQLSISDNITLASRYHGKASEESIAADAVRLARQFGLPGLPTAPTDKVPEPDLRRAELVRALLGDPALILLERPTRAIYPEIMRPLIQALQAAREKGAAVLFTTSNAKVWESTAIRPTYRFRMSGSQLLEITR
ncbi:MAG: ATP-binding cassette domain-containing protein [Phycisphaeraceae bacterium]